MLNLVAMIAVMAGAGLIAAGSALAVPAFLLAGSCWWWSDTFGFDVEMLGGALLLLFMLGIVYAVLRSIWVFTFA